jgi:alkanesulfonate monooxygenase SsuD/methylene tetrahydromethanopterin reductase-like flavin-dependent oxidoreductase (luciferase family)
VKRSHITERIDPDKPLRPELFGYTEDQSAPVGFVRSFAEITAAEEITPRQLVRRVEGGHRLAIGTARDVADSILEWWSEGAVDGFNIHIPVLPDGIAEFNREVIPLLQAAGAFPTAYDGSTLRERFGLRDPLQAPAAAGSTSGAA